MNKNSRKLNLSLTVVSLVLLTVSIINIAITITNNHNAMILNDKIVRKKEELRLMDNQIKSYDKMIKEKSDRYDQLVRNEEDDK